MFSYDAKIRVPRWLIKGLTLASNTEKKKKKEREKQKTKASIFRSQSTKKFHKELVENYFWSQPQQRTDVTGPPSIKRGTTDPQIPACLSKGNSSFPGKCKAESLRKPSLSESSSPNFRMALSSLVLNLVQKAPWCSNEHFVPKRSPHCLPPKSLGELLQSTKENKDENIAKPQELLQLKYKMLCSFKNP